MNPFFICTDFYKKYVYTACTSEFKERIVRILTICVLFLNSKFFSWLTFKLFMSVTFSLFLTEWLFSKTIWYFVETSSTILPTYKVTIKKNKTFYFGSTQQYYVVAVFSSIKHKKKMNNSLLPKIKKTEVKMQPWW
jgi:hypothetical protein